MKHFLFYLLVFLMQFSFAQRRQIDSLLNLIKYDKEDTIKVKHLIDISSTYEDLRYFDSALFFANNSYQLAGKLNYKIGIAAFWCSMGHINMHKGNHSIALDFLSKSLKMEEGIGNKKGIALNLDRLGELYNMRNDYTLALDYFSKAQKIFEEIKDTDHIANVLGHRSDINLSKMEYNEAIKNVFKALQLNQQIKNKTEVASNYNALGVIFFRLNDYSKAMDYFLKALKIGEEENDKWVMIEVFNSLGSLFYDQYDEAAAKKYFSKALMLSEELGDEGGSAKILYNLGDVYRTFKDPNIALRLYTKAFEYSKKMNDKLGMGDFFIRIGGLYSVDKNPAQKLKFELVALKLFEQTQYKYGVLNVLGKIGHAYSHLGQYSKAKKYLLKALSIADSLKLPDDISGINDFLHELYVKTGDYKKALECYKITERVIDSLYDQGKTMEIVRKQVNYEFEKKTAEEEKKATEYKNQKARLKLIIYLIISLLVIGILSTLFISNRIKKSRIIAEQQKLLQATIEAQEQERKRIAEDLHDGVGQSLIIFKNVLGSSTSKEDLQKFNEIIDEVRTLSHQMMPAALTKFGLTEALQDLLSNNKLPFNCKFEATSLKERLSANIEINLYRVVQELINNIIKHAQATEVEVQLYQSKNHLIITVEDNGKGFNINEASKQKGMGISNIKSRLRSVKGEISFEKAHDSGTLAIIKVPILI